MELRFVLTVSENWANGMLSRASLVEMKAFQLRVQGQKLETRWPSSTRDQGEQEQRIISRLFHLGSL